MFECFEKNIQEMEAKDAKAKGLKADELQKKNSHNAAMIVVCLPVPDMNWFLKNIIYYFCLRSVTKK